jgi:cytochrome b
VGFKTISPSAAAGFGAFLLCALFFALGILWIDRPGIQTDEVLFADGIYPPYNPEYVLHIFKHPVPIMVMPYVGSAKSWLWKVIFAVWPPSPYSVRIPSLLLGALSVWLFYRLMARTFGVRAGLAGAALLATDPIYLLYARWDHGPTVIQHLCLISAMLCFVRFYQEKRLGWLALGSFACGLGMWDKAIFVWLLGGLSVSACIVFWREIRSLLSVRSAATAVVAVVLGSAPLIHYNRKHDWETFRSNAVWSPENLAGKAWLLRATANGEALFGAIMREPWDGPLKAPSTAMEKAVAILSERAGSPRITWLGYLLFFSILATPFVWGTPARKAVFFCLISGAIAWAQMAFTKGAGTGAHHAILLWPLPAFVVAAVLSALSFKVKFGRALLIAVISAAAIVNILVLSTYYTNLVKGGGTASWTDAVYPALAATVKMHKNVCTIDWGFGSTVRMYAQGRTEVCEIAIPDSEEGRRAALEQISRPGYVFLTHTEGNELFPGRNAAILMLAKEQGYIPVNRRVFEDSNGRPTVEIFEFARQTGASLPGGPAP